MSSLTIFKCWQLTNTKIKTQSTSQNPGRNHSHSLGSDPSVFGCRGWRLRVGLGAGDQSSDVSVVQARGEEGLEQGSEIKARRGS